MAQQSARPLGESDAHPPWSMFVGGTSGAWSDAGGPRLSTPVLARSPEGLIFGSLDVPTGEHPPRRDSDATMLALRRRLAGALLELERHHRIMVTAGHDLRQPLQVLTMILERLAAAPRADCLDLLEIAGTEIDRLSQGLGDLARAAFGSANAAPNLRRFTVCEPMEAAIERWDHHIRASRTRLGYVRSTTAVVSDPTLLATILDNLLGNAIKYAAGGRVLFGCRRREGRLAIEVLDTGPGIAKARMDDWRCGRANPASGGLGLGLYIVRRTVELLGLEMIVASQPGRGSRFTVFLPVA
jgi:signal transduction histidine kinase